METKKRSEREWGRSQVEQYKLIYPKYKLYAETLQQVLIKVAKKYAPQSIVQSRPKAIASFAEKIYRKKAESSDPVRQFTDLCGGRIITNTHDEVEAISRYIEDNFEIDWENSIDVSQRLKPAEFGYRSIHYIVSFKQGVFPSRDVAVTIPPEAYGLKAEIQVRTLLEHVWADFSHTMAYKRGFSIPKKWERELASLAAVLENADGSLMRIRDGMRIYSSCYNSYMSRERMLEELDKLEAVLEYDSGNAELADRIGLLAMNLGDNKKAVDVFFRFSDTDYAPLIRDLGIATYKLHKADTGSAAYRKGQQYLEKACSLAKDDVHAITAYAKSWDGIDDEKARELYGNAFDIDPTDPLVLCNYLENEIAYMKDTSVIAQVKSNILAAVGICRQQIDVSINLPAAYYNMGKLYLFLGKPYDSMNSYAKAIQLSPEAWMAEAALQSLYKLRSVQKQLSGYEWVRQLLMIGLASKFDGFAESLKPLSQDEKLEVPVILMVGGCGIPTKEMADSYHALMLEAFKNYRGTVISSGLKSGVSGMIGEFGKAYPGIKTIGYMPKLIPADMTKDDGYGEFRYTCKDFRYVEDNGFCALEPLKKWIDIIASGIKPADVRLMGIGGGRLAAFEYRLGLALGAHVALLEGSGFEAAKLSSDDEWKAPNMPISLPDDVMTLRAFIGSSKPIMEQEIRESLGKKVHEKYWDNQFKEKIGKEESMKKWDELLPYLKESNRQQADSMVEKLSYIGCAVRKANGNGTTPFEFTEDEVERMAEMEHGRWNVERLLDGWTYGTVKDVLKKISPYLVSWKELSDGVKKWDRQAVVEIPVLLAGIGMEIYRLDKN